MRVVDWHKWQRAKAIGAGLCVVAAICCIGGLEDTGTQGTPSPEGFVFFIGLAFWCTWSYFKHDRKHG